MTIDEAIAKYKEITNTDANCPAHCNISCDKCVQESEQIAEWLEELKALKSEPIDCGSDLGKSYYYNLGRENGYNKAIDVACEYLKCEWAVDNLQTCDDFDKIAEQLKAGGEE